MRRQVIERVCDIFKSHLIGEEINQLFQSSPGKKECLCQVADWIWKIADLFSFSWSLLMRLLCMKEIQRPEKYNFNFARYRLWMTKRIISARTKFGVDYFRVSHEELESCWKQGWSSFVNFVKRLPPDVISFCTITCTARVVCQMSITWSVCVVCWRNESWVMWSVFQWIE